MRTLMLMIQLRRNVCMQTFAFLHASQVSIIPTCDYVMSQHPVEIAINELEFVMRAMSMRLLLAQPKAQA